MKAGSGLLNEAQRQLLLRWWQALQPEQADGEMKPPSSNAERPFGYLGRGARARLKRCHSAVELLMEPAVLSLAKMLIAAGHGKWPIPEEPLSYERIAWMAGVLALVKEDAHDGKSLAWRLGNAMPRQGNSPAMSELRFRRLQRTQIKSDLFMQWRRAVLQVEKKVDVSALGEDLLAWLAEAERYVSPSQSVKFRWAHDYYLTEKDQDNASFGDEHKEKAE